MGAADARERVVELCSAGNALEAYALYDILQEAGIQARIVGELLGSAAGSLPLGETVAPRIWVREADAERAREVIAEQVSQARQESATPDEWDERAEAEAASENESGLLTPRVWIRVLGQAGVLIGVAIILVGGVWAGQRWIKLRQCSAKAEGVLVRYRPHFSSYHPPPPEIPLPRQGTVFSIWYEAEYAYLVNGKTYSSVVTRSEQPVPRVPIHYDPHHPATNILSPLTPPRSILAYAMGIGCLLLCIGYYLARRDQKGHSKA